MLLALVFAQKWIYTIMAIEALGDLNKVQRYALKNFE